jgi:hypothetical protein
MEWNGMEWNGMEWNGMEWNGIKTPASYTCKKDKSRERRGCHPRLYL